MRGIADGRYSLRHRQFPVRAAINIAIGKIFVHQITGRISGQDPLYLRYNWQFLLQTLPGVQTELRDSGYIKYCHEKTRRILAGPCDLDALTDFALLPNGSEPLHPPCRTPAPVAAPATPPPVRQPAAPIHVTQTSASAPAIPDLAAPPVTAPATPTTSA